MAEFDDVAALYDQTRGGEQRGDDYANEIDDLLPSDGELVLEVGVGTGVVALGLVRRGRRIIGADISRPMLARARERLGPIVVRTDAEQLPLPTQSVGHVVSVWVIHALAHPERHFSEAARVMAPGGLYVVCSGQRPADGDEAAQIVKKMAEQIDIKRGTPRPRRVTTDQVLEWAASAELVGDVLHRPRQWRSKPSDEIFAIENRTWPAMRQLDELDLEEVTGPAIEALRALPQSEWIHHEMAEIVVLRHG